MTRKQHSITERPAIDLTPYTNAAITNSIARGLRGTKKLSQKYPNMIRLRYYKAPDGSIRRTVEIAID